MLTKEFLTIQVPIASVGELVNLINHGRDGGTESFLKQEREPVMTLKQGDQAPDFTLATDGNGSVTLSALRGKKVILYFYPRDDTPGCTIEACGFRDALPDFSGAGAVVLGISKDTVVSHDNFKNKFSLPFTLAADVDGEVVQAYDVWVERENKQGEKAMGIQRATFLINEQGKIAHIWPKVTVAGHVEEVLAAVKAT